MARSSKTAVRVRPDGQKGLFAIDDVASGEVLLTYDGPVLDHPTRHSIQVDDHRHIEGTEDSNAFVNHSCKPSAYVDWGALCLRAIAPLAVGDEITCNYLTTDFELSEPFTCRCGAAACRREIRGFKFLPREEQEALAPWLPPFLRRRLEQC